MQKIKLYIQKLASSTVLRKAFHTFWQTFLATVLVGEPMVEATVRSGGLQAGETAIIALLTAALAAGLSALKNSAVNVYQASK